MLGKKISYHNNNIVNIQMFKLLNKLIGFLMNINHHFNPFSFKKKKKNNGIFNKI